MAFLLATAIQPRPPIKIVIVIYRGHTVHHLSYKIPAVAADNCCDRAQAGKQATCETTQASLIYIFSLHSRPMS